MEKLMNELTKQQFEKHLKATGKIKENIIPYYLLRVSQCLSFFSKADGESILNEEKDRFLASLITELEEWQIKQADYAIKLYSFFVSSNSEENREPFASDWNKITDKFRDTLRLQHKSFSTEKTYLLWLKSFRYYLDEKELSTLSFEDLQKFLTHLAVEKA